MPRCPAKPSSGQRIQFHGDSHQIGKILRQNFFHDSRAVIFDGAHTNFVLPRNILVGLTFGQELKYLTFALCE